MVIVSTNITKYRKALLLIGSIGPLGHAPASGSVTVAVIGVPMFWLMSEWTSPVYLVFVAIFSAAAVWLHDVGDRLLGEKDSRKLVWDELVGFMIAVYLVPFTWQLALIAFLVERVIDIVKVPPANWIERRVRGGWGVVGDDVVAGIYTCFLLQFLIRFFPGAVGLGA